ncbi:MAG: ABC transporter ATP-binding protein [Planktomarina sp.]
MLQSAICLEGLTKTYAPSNGGVPKTALDHVDLTIPAGSIFGLLGPNGAGKSTMINIMAGLVTKSAGRVTIGGFDQDINPRQSRAAIGVMPQELNLDPFFTPRGALDVQAGLYGVPRKDRKTDEILALIGLTDKADAYARSLSGGMRRRLLLGKALVHSPKILVLDEPTAGVDIGLRQMLWENVRQLHAQGTTIILTTHYLEEAQEMCDQIAILDKGRIRVQDTTQNLLSRLDQKTLVFEVDKATSPVLDHVTVEKRGDNTIALSFSRGHYSADQLIDAVRKTGAGIRDITSEQADLEDVFLSLTSSSK